jgi:hypothetical protein
MEDMMDAEEEEAQSRGDTSVRERDMFDDDDGSSPRAVIGSGGETDSEQLLSSHPDSSDQSAAVSSMVSAEHMGGSDDGQSDDEDVANLPPPPPAFNNSRREMDFESMMDSAKLPESDEDDVEVDEFGLPVIETESNPLATPEADNVLDGLDDLAGMVGEDTTTHANPLASADSAVGSGAPVSKAEELLLKARARRGPPEPATETTYVDADGAELENFDL